MSHWVVEHDCIGVSTRVKSVGIGKKNKETLGYPLTISFTQNSSRMTSPEGAARFTKLEAVMLAAHLDGLLQETCRKEHPNDYDDWIGNYGIWYAAEIEDD